MKKLIQILSVLLIISSCSSDEAKQNNLYDSKLFNLINATESGIDFVNVNKEDRGTNIGMYDYFYNGSGVGIADFNNDGLADIYFTANQVSNRIYKNLGDLKFEDVTKGSGAESLDRWSNGVSVIDINNDGLMDIYVSNSGHRRISNKENQLFINKGNFKFEDQAAAYGLNSDSYSSQACFFDFDNDKDLDMFLINHSNIFQVKTMRTRPDSLKKLSAEERARHGCEFFVNNGDGTFNNNTKIANVGKPAFGLGVVARDFNEDNLVDIYVANDFSIPDFMFINKGDGTFVDEITHRIKHASFYGMGCDAEDYNNDRLVDIAVVDMSSSDHIRSKTLMPSMNVDQFNYLVDDYGYVKQFMFNTLQKNMGYGSFSEVSMATNTAKTEWSWSPLFCDFDNDGFKDYFVSNGFKRDTKNNDWRLTMEKYYNDNDFTLSNYYDHIEAAPSKALKNFIYQNDRNGNFVFRTDDWGLDTETFSNGAIYFDLDNDGDQDLITNNINSPACIFENLINSTNNYLKVKLSGTDEFSNAMHNAKLTLKISEDQYQYIEQSNVKGYYSSFEPTVQFGLGKQTEIAYLEVLLTNGKHAFIKDLKINELNLINLNNLEFTYKTPKKFDPMFADVTKMLFGSSSFYHQENPHNDFDEEVLLPHKQSTLGPFISVADVNNDQLEDFFIGNSYNTNGLIFTQKRDGKFDVILAPTLAKNVNFEEMGSSFIDVNKDNLMDLYVASGGGADVSDSDLLSNNIYLNDGNNSFVDYDETTPGGVISNGRVIKADYDNDDDDDLLILGRTDPGNYPNPVKTTLLVNNDGNLEDMTDELAPALMKLGMATDAVFVDFDSDKDLDLVITTEWNNIRFLKNDDNHFTEVSESMGVNDLKGWWYSIASCDFDRDGDMDLIVGNVGINNKFQPSKDKPLKLFSNDFDDNGTNDIVLSKKYQGKDVPIRGKQCSSEQMPFIKDSFPSYQGFAEASLQDILGEDNLSEARVLEANTFKSYYLENTGGKFKAKVLPDEAQLFPINSMIVHDFDQDGKDDVALAGNIFNTEPETPSYDAGKGLFMKGNGDGSFTVLSPFESGFIAQRNVKDIQLIRLTEQQIPGILVGNNNGEMQVFAYTR